MTKEIKTFGPHENVSHCDSDANSYAISTGLEIFKTELTIKTSGGGHLNTIYTYWMTVHYK